MARRLSTAVWGWRGLPGVLLALLILADLIDGSRTSVIGLFLAVPFVASVNSQEGEVAGWAVTSLVAGVAMGFYDDAYRAVALPAQVERLVVLALAGLLAVGTAKHRRQREETLRSTGELADALQELLLPSPPPRVGAVEVAVSYRAAAAAARVGGDLFDLRTSAEGTRVLIGDVQGKGLPAVRMAAVVLAAFREHNDRRTALVDLLGDLDRAVVRESGDDDEMFVTALLVEVGAAGLLGYTSAGHPPPLLVRDGRARLLPHRPGALPLGVRLGDQSEGSGCEQLQVGDRLLLYTDGTTEARSPRTGEEFPLLERAASLLVAGTLAEGLAALEVAVDDWSGHHLADDAALVLLEIPDERVAPTVLASGRPLDRRRRR